MDSLITAAAHVLMAGDPLGAALVLNTPAARLIARGEERLLLLEDVEALLASRAFPTKLLGAHDPKPQSPSGTSGF
jgi:hypothetical protein